MMSESTKVSLELSKVKAIWKQLIKNNSSDAKRISDAFSRFKSFLEENKDLLDQEIKHIREVDMVETLLNHYQQSTAHKEKAILLNDAYVGLIFSISESIEELKNKLQENHEEVVW